MTDFKQLIKLLTESVDNFQKVIPGIQRGMLDRLREELQALKLNGRNIAISAENVRKIASIKAKLGELILTKEYKAAVKDYLKAFDEVTALQNQYFKDLERTFKPPKLAKELQKQAVKGVLQNLTERGIEANILMGIEDILRKNITTGGSYAELQRALQNNLTNNGTGDGSLQRYTKQMTTDALNQHSAQYTQLIASDLGLEWFRYSGSNIETTRPFCLACVEKKWIHISEFPALLRGEFPEFEKYDGKMYKGLPAGMIPDTTPSNFPINRGGFNCGHQLRPVNAAQVPAEVRARFEAPSPEKEVPKETGIGKAATIEEAEQIALSSLKLKGDERFGKKYKGADYSTFSPDLANNINVKVTELHNKYGAHVKSINGDMQNDGAYGQAGILTRELKYNGKRMNDVDDYIKRISSSIESGSNALIDKVNYRYKTITHEYGHLVAAPSRIKWKASADPTYKAAYQEWSKLSNEYYRKASAADRKIIGDYANKNDDELFAEVFTHYELSTEKNGWAVKFMDWYFKHEKTIKKINKL